MMKSILALAAVTLVAAATPALAADYTFTFSGTGQAGMGKLTTDGVTFDSRGYTAQTITGVTGTYNGSTITGLLPGLFGADNLYYVTGPAFLDGSGLGFSTAAGNQVNLFYQDSAPSYRVNTLNPFGSVFVSASSAAASAVPEASTWAMMLIGAGFLGMAMRRRQVARVFIA